MTTLYLMQQGTTLRKDQAQFLIQNQTAADPSASMEIAIAEVERILVFGNVQLTTQAIASCLAAQIPVVFLSYTGSYKGHLWSAQAQDLSAEAAQFQCYRDERLQLEIARAIVAGKVSNSRQLLLRLNRKHAIEAVAVAIAGLSRDLVALATVDDLNVLRGYEGTAAARYFPAFGQLLTQAEFQLTSRQRRPPTDPVNSMLSFGYTLLLNNVLSLILAEGLNPYLGNLHCSDRPEMQLGFDLMEEFRSPVVDSLVLTLVNQRQVKLTDFTCLGAGKGVYLTESARRMFLQKFEARLNDHTAHPDVQDPVSYRRAIQLQVRRYKRCLLNGVPYEAFLRAA